MRLVGLMLAVDRSLDMYRTMVNIHERQHWYRSHRPLRGRDSGLQDQPRDRDIRLEWSGLETPQCSSKAA